MYSCFQVVFHSDINYLSSSLHTLTDDWALERRPLNGSERGKSAVG